MHVETTRRQGKERQVLGAERGNKRRKKKSREGHLEKPHVIIDVNLTSLTEINTY